MRFENFLIYVPGSLCVWRLLIGCAALLASLGVAAQVEDSQAPTVPAGLTATATSGWEQIQLSWIASTDNAGVTQYTVYRNGVLVDAPVVWPAGTACVQTVSIPPIPRTCFTAGSAAYTYPDTFLDASTNYSYSVAACDAAGNCSAQSASASATTLPAPTPDVPGPLWTAVVSSSQVNLRWIPTVTSAGAAPIEFKIYRDGILLTSVWWTPFSGPAIYADSAVAASTSYGYTVTQCNAAGNCSAPSAPASATTPAATVQPDLLAPTVPNLTASAYSWNSTSLSWSAATDNIGVAAYQVYRAGALLATVPAPVLFFTDAGLTAATSHSYTVAACDLAGNCSAQSAPAAATTQPAFAPNLVPGWNLLGNSLGTYVDVVAVFGNPITPVAGVTENVLSVWKWNASLGRWAFYSPRLTLAANASYAASHNYDVLGAIASGEGYWVNAANPVTLPLQSGVNTNWRRGFGSYVGVYSHDLSALPVGFNLIATSDSVAPSDFNRLVTATPPSPGEAPTGNFVSLWAWEAPFGPWYFYSPFLESTGGLPAVKSYANSRGYRHFEDYNKTLGIGTGFWVNVADILPIVFSTIALGQDSGVATAQNLVVRDANAWASLWGTHTSNEYPPLSLPSVDFNTQMVLGVFLGGRPDACYSVQIQRVTQLGGRMTVEYKENTLMPGFSCAQVFTHPFHLIAVPQSSNPVDFIKTNP